MTGVIHTLKIHQQKFSFLVMILLSLFHLRYGILPGWKIIQNDFPNYYVSAKLLSKHQDLSVLYQNEAFNERVKSYGLEPVGQFALYSPPNALILLPLSGFSPIVAKRIWLSINILLIFACAWLVKKITQWPLIFSLNTILLSGFALTNDLFLGQVYLFITSLILLGICFYDSGKNYFTGFLWGAVLALKYISIAFIPSLIILRKWKILIGIISGVLLLYLICLPFFGITIFSYFFNHVLFSHFNGVLYEGRPYAIQYQSWDSLLNNLFVYDANLNPYPIINSMTLFYTFKYSILSMVAFILARFFKKAFHRIDFFEITISLSVISILILEPGSATYHNLFLIIPFVLILRLLLSYKPRQVLLYIFLFFLIGFLPAALNQFPAFHAAQASHSAAQLLFSYHRLWLEMIFYLCSVIFLHRIIQDNHFEALAKNE